MLKIKKYSTGKKNMISPRFDHYYSKIKTVVYKSTKYFPVDNCLAGVILYLSTLYILITCLHSIAYVFSYKCLLNLL